MLAPIRRRRMALTRLYPPAQFLAPGGTTYASTFAAELCNRLIALAGVPCAMIGYAVGGTGIDSWLPGYSGPNSGHWTKLVNVLTLAGGKFGTFIWDQGHYETKNGNTASNYYSQLQLLENNVDMAFRRPTINRSSPPFPVSAPTATARPQSRWCVTRPSNMRSHPG